MTLFQARNARLALFAAAAMLGLSACGGAGTGNAPSPAGGKQQANAGANAMQDRSYKSDAEKLFVEKCAMCHRDFGMGTVVLARRVEKGQEWLEKRTDLQADFVKTAARAGIGNMPRITRSDVSDAQLDAIAAYLEKAGRK
ncbi:hypothetical protein GCM10007897_30210 [Sphingobium jiangsuense]|uniref:Cytochrome c5 n=1 Tax=Sphingobium jiangsuense TaxID=870476 RepID=A0A7W6FQF7_9SPHN|nr:cytochrome c [Sphingobium jiangsuense]MBB3926895.1 cytochrome c5 [Sphingobium jiangsuense]GLT01627.1 hypothetical protein GCM10007897_30210 [Sphingobium jiangsuense]